MKIKVYHGTTRDNANKILAGKQKDSYTWTCSDDDMLYVWNSKVMLDRGECDNLEECEELCIRYAFESAQITAAMQEKPQEELVVLCFNIEEDFLDEDISCENMDYSSTINLKEPEYINHYMKTLSCDHNSRLDAFIISRVVDMPFFPSYKLDDGLLSAAEQLKEVFLDEFLEFNYKED